MLNYDSRKTGAERDNNNEFKGPEERQIGALLTFRSVFVKLSLLNAPSLHCGLPFFKGTLQRVVELRVTSNLMEKRFSNFQYETGTRVVKYEVQNT